MSSSHTQSIPKAPAERTLLVAVIILSLVAAVQLVAVGLVFAQRTDFEKLFRSLAPHPGAESASPQAAAADQSSDAGALLVEAQALREKNNYQGALEAVSEADRLLPNKPGILIQMAGDYYHLGKSQESVATLNKIVSLPPSTDPADAGYRDEAQKNLALMTGGGGVPARAVPSTAAADSTAAPSDIGIPTGSVMGIVTAKLLDGDPGQKNLQVSTKAATGQKIDPMKFQATVDFYEQDDHGQIVHNDSPRPNEWLSGPAIDWANGDPEIFQVKYRMPLEDRGDLPALQYYGYVVAIYYDGELQDQRADPPELLNHYAPPLHKDLPSE